MSDQHRDVPWTLGNSANPNESVLVTIAWLVGPIAICSTIVYLLW